MSDNLINKILNSKEPLKGELGKEQEAYKEFLSGNWNEEETDFSGLIVEFFPQYTDLAAEENGSALTKMAADAGSEDVFKNESYFYLSKDDTFALKIDEKTFPEETILSASIISEDGRDISKCILYCPETNKYFLNNVNNEINLSGFKKIDYKTLTFKLIYPKAKVFLVRQKGSEEFTAVSTNTSFNINNVKESDNNFSVEMISGGQIKALVLRSEKYFDFITINNNEILIAKTLVGEKFELLIY